jgi:hypothetical protein
MRQQAGEDKHELPSIEMLALRTADPPTRHQPCCALRGYSGAEAGMSIDIDKELQPCPFCGGAPTAFVAPCGYGIECSECNCRTDYHDSRSEAVSRRNRRAAQPAPIPAQPGIPKALAEWAQLTERDGTLWADGYDDARAYVRMQIAARPSEAPAGNALADPLASGYESGFFQSTISGGQITLHYGTSESAERAFIALTDAIDSHIKTTQSGKEPK